MEKRYQTHEYNYGVILIILLSLNVRKIFGLIYTTLKRNKLINYVPFYLFVGEFLIQASSETSYIRPTYMVCYWGAAMRPFGPSSSCPHFASACAQD